MDTPAEPHSPMPGLTEGDKRRIREFASKPRYERSDDDLEPDGDE